MSGSTIGIKIADGSYYPILDEGFTGRKKLTLTTVKDNQSKVQIDLYRGDGKTVDTARYIGSLVIENIRAASRGDPNVELVVGLDEKGELSASASDASTGESQSFSIGLRTLSEEETYEVPDFEIDESEEEPPALRDSSALPLPSEEMLPLEGIQPLEDSGAGGRDETRRRGPNAFLIVLLVVLGLALLAAIAYFVYEDVSGSAVKGSRAVVTSAQKTDEAPARAPEAPAPKAVSTEKPEAGAESPKPAVAERQGSEKPAPAAGATEQAAAQPAASPPPKEEKKGSGALIYRIKNGDTLWDLSATYYRNPWLYPKLAKANKIRNPDLIFAGTKITIPEE